MSPCNARTGVAIALAAWLGLAGCLGTAFAAAPPPLRAELETFVEQMSAKHGIAAAELRAILAQAKVQRDILRAMTLQTTPTPWHRYRPIYVNPERIAAGARFWREHGAVLERAAREFGVPEELIVATIGVETSYGRYMGSHRVLDALVTLAFDFPRRADFFRGELEQFLLLARTGAVDALATRGSYAGAIGIPQFMPSSYQRYAVDFDGDGRIRLVEAVADAIGSVASYYRAHGWVQGAPIVVEARVEQESDAVRALLDLSIEPQITEQALREAGVSATGHEGAGPSALLRLETGTGPQYWLGLRNFYVITRYNRSVNYAMSVYELAREIRAAWLAAR